MTRRSIRVLLAGVSACTMAFGAAGACSSPPSGNPDAGVDSSAESSEDASDVAVVDVVTDKIVVPDGGSGPPACPFDGAVADATTVYDDFTSSSNWTSFDLTALSAPSGHVHSFAGGTFDGRYVYFVPRNPVDKFDPSDIAPYAVRYDTQSALDAGTAWEIFDVTQLSYVQVGTSFAGAAFDGRYVYFAPASGVAVRFDTQGSFVSASSWESVGVSASTYTGAVFDGRYVTFVPTGDTYSPTAAVLRYDTTGAFTDGASWQTAALTSMDGGPPGAYWGGVYDGQHVYLVPQTTGQLPRYDPNGPFDAAASWQAFDMTTVDPPISINDAAPKFPNTSFISANGAAFDGRYVYPAFTSTELARYDTQLPYDAAASWEYTEHLTLNPMATGFFWGTAFDGRFVYYLPPPSGGALIKPTILYRFDTAGCFDTVTPSVSWQSVDLTTIEFVPLSFVGAVFDGRYLYLVGDRVMRFDAKSPPSMPPSFSGSFF
jgi:hypothetical protein